MKHVAGAGNWTRDYTYAPGGNRLATTQVGAGPTLIYPHDSHGNMQSFGGFGEVLSWNHRDELASYFVGTGEATYYQYDASGQRVRKYSGANDSNYGETIYLGGFEVVSNVSGGDETRLETICVSDGQSRVCTVERKTWVDGSPSSSPVNWRFQLGNHLGSASVELDEAGEVISYEEYHPYGSTSYRSHRPGGANLSLKRYRFTGKERDDESGLYYHGARYYAAWLGRWTAADPIGIGDGLNRFAYVRGNPVRLTDPDGTSSDPNRPPMPSDYKSEGEFDRAFKDFMNSPEVNEAKRQKIAPKRTSTKKPEIATIAKPHGGVRDGDAAGSAPKNNPAAKPHGPGGLTPLAREHLQNVGYGLMDAALGLAVGAGASALINYAAGAVITAPLWATGAALLGGLVLAAGIAMLGVGIAHVAQGLSEGWEPAHTRTATGLIAGAAGAKILARLGLGKTTAERPKSGTDEVAGAEFVDDVAGSQQPPRQRVNIADIVSDAATRQQIKRVFDGREPVSSLNEMLPQLIDLYRQTAHENPAGSAQAAFNEARALFLEGKGPSPGNNVVKFAEKHGFPVARRK
jgi:RHS repeat-associated protein